MTSGTPRAINGVRRLLNPYECETGMTPKFRSVPEIPLVSQIWSQSASNCSLRKQIARGAAVVPEVSFRSDGGLLPQSGAAADVLMATTSGLPPGTLSAITALAPQISSAASRC